ncbi:TM2 domain-containing protein [Cohnella pontilimi]|uniref:TM2 domain-containing protein n=1 Tax=Cohnella pontilimi TaxID=2564100 RepID=A0A4U0F2Z8_9BACL|nr:TM2 domain-containing protein [Cohnella pontilimi]TJY38528.1 TM2 domain-containing protein [Cohnella pontilimi]
MGIQATEMKLTEESTMNEWEQSRHNRYEPEYPPGYPQDPRLPVRKKSKWAAGLLAFFIPGIGHFYLGLMAKGIAIMLLIALDICAIVYAGTNHLSPLVIVLLSLMLPILYFYNLFDALQSTEAINDRRLLPGWAPGVHGMQEQSMHGQPAAGTPGGARNMSPTGLVLLAGAGVILVLAADMRWTHWLFKSTGTMIGAVVLIGAGIGLWFWETRGQSK